LPILTPLVALLPLFGCAGTPADSAAEGSSSTPQWAVAGLTLAPDGLNYAVVSGTVSRMDVAGSGGTRAEVRFFSDDYRTLIVAVEETIGADLEGGGMMQEFSLRHYEVYVRPATNGYERVCAMFRADGSNYEGWSVVGCLPETSGG
jgi:hypothetical protein